MGTTYLTPGVYVEEVDSGPQPIEGVSTSITGAVGVTVMGPTSGKPVSVTSFAQFQQIFGGFMAPPGGSLQTQWLDPVEGGAWWQFPLAVKSYFDNGGQVLYVKRVFAAGYGANPGAQPATASFYQGVVAEIAQNTLATSTTVKLAHTVEVDTTKTLNFYSNGKLVAGGPFAVTAYDSNSNMVTLGGAIGYALNAGDLAVIDALSAQAAASQTLQFSAKALGNCGNSISVRVMPVVGSVYTLEADPATGGNSFTTQLSAPAKAADTNLAVVSSAGFNVGDNVRIGSAVYVVSALPDATHVTVGPAMPAALLVGTNITRLRPAAATNATSMHISDASDIYTNAILQFDNGTKKETFVAGPGSITGDLFTLPLGSKFANNYYEGQQVRVIEAQVDVLNTVAGVVQATESWPNLRLYNDQTISYLVTWINQNSAFVNVQTVAPGYSWNLLSQFPAVVLPAGSTTLVDWAPLTGGLDNYGNLTVEDFIGVDGGSGMRTGIQALEDITDISICVVPGIWAQSVQEALINHCETLKYRFGIIDPPDQLSIDQIMSWRAPIDTEYAALYYPWVQVLDPFTVSNVDLAPSAAMAGIYALTDNTRGVFKAPANVEIAMINKIAQDVNKREQGLLNPIGINALRYFPERGNRVWGARTLSSESDWKYINVRRLFIYVEASIDNGTQWVVFEPNDQTLWARVRQTITDFLTTTWLSGALQGTTPAQAFFVKCDQTTMTQDDIDNGRLICLIGIAPVMPAEFVIFRIQQYTQTTTS